MKRTLTSHEPMSKRYDACTIYLLNSRVSLSNNDLFRLMSGERLEREMDGYSIDISNVHNPNSSMTLEESMSNVLEMALEGDTDFFTSIRLLNADGSNFFQFDVTKPEKCSDSIHWITSMIRENMIFCTIISDWSGKHISSFQKVSCRDDLWLSIELSKRN